MADQDWEVVTQSSAANFGFAFLDAAAGRYYLGSVSDDAGRANLSSVITQVYPPSYLFVTRQWAYLDGRCIIASSPRPCIQHIGLSQLSLQVSPKEIIYIRNGLSKATMRNLASSPVAMQRAPTDSLDFAEGDLIHSDPESVSDLRRKVSFYSIPLKPAVLPLLLVQAELKHWCCGSYCVEAEAQLSTCVFFRQLSMFHYPAGTIWEFAAANKGRT